MYCLIIAADALVSTCLGGVLIYLAVRTEPEEGHDALRSLGEEHQDEPGEGHDTISRGPLPISRTSAFGELVCFSALRFVAPQVPLL